MLQSRPDNQTVLGFLSNKAKIILKTFCRLLYHFHLSLIERKHFEKRDLSRDEKAFPNNIVFTAFLAGRKEANERASEHIVELFFLFHRRKLN